MSIRSYGLARTATARDTCPPVLVQYAGRLHRLRDGKEEVRVYDYVDGSVPMLVKMHEKRMKGSELWDMNSDGYNLYRSDSSEFDPDVTQSVAEPATVYML